MKCPLFHRPKLDWHGRTSYQTGDCLEEECAWWDPSLNLCCVRTIAGKLDDIDTRQRNVAWTGGS